MPHAVLERVVPATFPEVGRLRRATNAFLQDGYTPTFRDKLTLVVSELCTNAIEALHDEHAEFTLRLCNHIDRVQIEVEDDGPGFSAALDRRGADEADARGRGLQVVLELVDEFSVNRAAGRTCVTCVLYRL
ncbi:MAG: Histidine kinaselike ATPase domain [Actinomycetota bacterium]|jgi:anti-sigma regulatory factor (Ser/Thr protein kinase)